MEVGLDGTSRKESERGTSWDRLVRYEGFICHEWITVEEMNYRNAVGGAMFFVVGIIALVIFLC